MVLSVVCYDDPHNREKFMQLRSVGLSSLKIIEEKEFLAGIPSETTHAFQVVTHLLMMSL